MREKLRSAGGNAGRARPGLPGRRARSPAPGYVGVDGHGLGGVEHALDPLIRGEPGRRTVWTDGRRTGQRSQVDVALQPGPDVELTLDLRAQAIAEEELERGIEEIGAAGGNVVLVDVGSGEILAMASAPSFHPEHYRDADPSRLRNRALTDPYEPGSTFKIITAAAALEEGVAQEAERFETFGGEYRIGRRTVRDWRPLGALSFSGVVERSSNIGMLQVARRLGSSTLGGPTSSGSGSARPPGLGLGGESRGIAPPATGKLAAHPARHRLFRTGHRGYAGADGPGG